MKRTTLVAAALITLASCGSGEPAKVSLDDTSTVARAEVALTTYCLNGNPAPSGGPDIFEATDQLVAIFRKDPEATYQPGGTGEKLTMRQVLSDRASGLDDCDGDLAAQLDRALDAGD